MARADLHRGALQELNANPVLATFAANMAPLPTFSSSRFDLLQPWSSSAASTSAPYAATTTAATRPAFQQQPAVAEPGCCWYDASASDTEADADLLLDAIDQAIADARTSSSSLDQTPNTGLSSGTSTSSSAGYSVSSGSQCSTSYRCHTTPSTTTTSSTASTIPSTSYFTASSSASCSDPSPTTGQFDLLQPWAPAGCAGGFGSGNLLWSLLPVGYSSGIGSFVPATAA